MLDEGPSRQYANGSLCSVEVWRIMIGVTLGDGKLASWVREQIIVVDIVKLSKRNGLAQGIW